VLGSGLPGDPFHGKLEESAERQAFQWKSLNISWMKPDAFVHENALKYFLDSWNFLAWELLSWTDPSTPWGCSTFSHLKDEKSSLNAGGSLTSS
jgi:hypothetical protein